MFSYATVKNGIKNNCIYNSCKIHDNKFNMPNVYSKLNEILLSKMENI